MQAIDGSMGEGGGQVLRSSLALSLATGTPFRMTNVRAGRKRPGLMRQHLVCVEAAARIGGAEVDGAEIGSTDLCFRPKAVRGGEYTFAIGSAGSTTLVFQTVVLPLLLRATTPSTLHLVGGTHNPMAPPVDFLQEAYLPALAKLGARIDLTFERYGFYPAGGGAWSATIHPTKTPSHVSFVERGDVRSRRATAVVARIPSSIAVRETTALATALAWESDDCRPLVVRDSHGPGNVLLAFVESEHVTEVFSGCGERGTPAEAVARRVAEDVTRYLGAGVPVGEYLADQLLLPMALGAGGVFRTLRPSTHFTTQVDLLRLFLDVEITVEEESDDVWRITVPAKS